MSYDDSAVMQSLLDSANGIKHVVVGYYSDRSGAKLFGVFDSKILADRAAGLIRAAESPYLVRVLPLPLNEFSGVEIFA